MRITRHITSFFRLLGGMKYVAARLNYLEDLERHMKQYGERLDTVEKKAEATRRKVYRDAENDEPVELSMPTETRIPNVYLDGGKING